MKNNLVAELSSGSKDDILIGIAAKQRRQHKAHAHDAWFRTRVAWALEEADDAYTNPLNAGLRLKRHKDARYDAWFRRQIAWSLEEAHDPDAKWEAAYSR